MILAFVVSVFLVIQLKTQITWIVTAAFLAIALNPAVVYMSRLMPKKNRTLAIFAVIGTAVALLTFVIAALVPPLIDQTRAFFANLPAYLDRIQHSSGPIGDALRQYDVIERAKVELSRFFAGNNNAGTGAWQFVSGLFGGVISTLTIVVMTFLMLREGPAVVQKFWSWHRSPQKARNEAVVERMYKSVTGYVIGNLLTSVICAIATAIALVVLGVPYAIPIALLVGMLDLLPLVGATLGAVVAVTVGLLQSITVGLILIIFFLIYQQFENTILVPYVYGKTVQMSPLVVFISALIGAALGGIVGALISVPVGASITILAREFLARRSSAK